MGLRGYEGATPPWVLWNLLQRYTGEGDLVVDPFCGGGTTLDVARSLGRRALGYDLNPVRPDVFRADARALPLEDGKADFVFMDPPYSTHIEYSDDPRCIGKLSAFEDAYYEAFEAVFEEVDRVLRDQRVLALFVSDSWDKKRGFAPIATRLAGQLARRFRPVDHIAVVRGNRDLEKGNYHIAAEEQNFYLRGFTHLLLFRKESARGGLDPRRAGGRKGKGEGQAGGHAGRPIGGAGGGPDAERGGATGGAPSSEPRSGPRSTGSEGAVRRPRRRRGGRGRQPRDRG
jgi:adenine-specific DNA-methyltransferase